MKRIGWIGCGKHANEMILPQLWRAGFQVTHLCDLQADALHVTAGRFGVARTAQDWREVLANADLDAVGVAAGPRQHAEIATAAVERGLPIFIEKPPAADAAAATALARLSEHKRVPVVMGFMKRYSTANRMAIRLVHAAEFGERASFLGHYMTAPTYFAKDVDYTGFYLHHCVHYLDLVPHLMGQPLSLNVRRHELAPGKLLLHVDFEFEGGGLATLVMGTHQSRATPMEWWQVMGDHQRVEVRNVHEVRYYRAPKFKVDDPEATLVDGEDTLVWEPNLTVAANEDHKGYLALLRDFAAVVDGHEPAGIPLAGDGARAMRMLEAMTHSIGSHERVRF